MNLKSSNRLVQKESISSFYNSIAADYENQLTDFDRKAREEIMNVFNSNVSNGTVLDFGGGTGLDLPQLARSQSRVVFLEPSSAMRSIAKVKMENDHRVSILESELDFIEWSSEKLPFKEKVDGVLVNFAVLNCIKDIRIFFEKIALVCKKNSHMIITVIDPRFKQIIKNYSFLTCLRLYSKNTLTILNRSKGIYHETHLHTIGAIKRAAEPYFEVKSIANVNFSNFIVISLLNK